MLEKHLVVLIENCDRHDCKSNNKDFILMLLCLLCQINAQLQTRLTDSQQGYTFTTRGR